MVGAADHAPRGQIEFERHSLRNGDRPPIPVGRWIAIDFLPSNLHPAACRNFVRGLVHEHQRVLARLQTSVPQINLQHRLARHAIDRVGKNLPFARSRHRVRTAGGEHRFFHRERQLGRRQRRIVAPRHEHRASVSALALDPHPIGARPGDGLHDADGNIFLLEQRPLLDMQFDKSGIEVLRQRNGLQRLRQVGPVPQLLERLALRITQRAQFVQRHGPGQHPRAQTADPETRRFLGREDHKLDRTHRTKFRLLQRLDGGESTQHTDHAIEFPRIGNRINVRSRRHRRCGRRTAFPAREHIAHRIDAQGKPGFFAKTTDKIAPAQIGVRKKHTRHGRRFRLGDEREVVDALLQARGIDFRKAGRHHPRRDARLTSL